MISSFNVTKLNQLLQNFYTISKFSITVYDENFQEIVSYPRELPPFCSLIRTCSRGMENCLKCDKAACLQAANTHKLYTYSCHTGLTECIVPIILGEIVIGYFLFGHITPCEDPDTGWNMVKKCCIDYPLDMELLEQYYRELHFSSDSYINSAAQIMTAVASYLCTSQMASLKYDSLPLQVDKYIQSHLNENLSSTALCEIFSLSRTRLYQISSENFGMGITDYIRKIRVQNAARLLETTDESISQIASSVGIYDYNYFTKVFKKQIGLTPRDYKKSLKSQPESDTYFSSISTQS